MLFEVQLVDTYTIDMMSPLHGHIGTSLCSGLPGTSTCSRMQALAVMPCTEEACIVAQSLLQLSACHFDVALLLVIYSLVWVG